MLCHICGCKLAESKFGATAHMQRFHNVALNKLKHRPKALVVADWEQKNARFIIDGSKADCHKECRCQRCFQAALDRLVDSTEVAKNVSRIGLNIHHDIPSYEL